MLVKNNSGRFHSSLSESGEDYLEAILLLGAQKSPVRVKDIARCLGVSRPSVVNALTQLETRGLVRHEHYGGVELTDTGRHYATAVYRRHLLLEQFLHQVLGVSAEIASQDACRLEHALSPQTTQRLMGFIRRLGVR